MFSAKKLTIVCATFGLAVLLSACGGGGSGSTASTSTTTGVTSAAATTASSSSSSASTTQTSTTVTTTAANTVAISWVPPTQNVDGSVLTDLTSYKIYYGTSPDNLSDSVRVDANITSYMMSGLVSGTTYYFAITSMNSVGTESDLSNVASKTV